MGEGSVPLVNCSYLGGYKGVVQVRRYIHASEEKASDCLGTKD